LSLREALVVFVYVVDVAPSEIPVHAAAIIADLCTWSVNSPSEKKRVKTRSGLYPAAACV